MPKTTNILWKWIIIHIDP